MNSYQKDIANLKHETQEKSVNTQTRVNSSLTAASLSEGKVQGVATSTIDGLLGLECGSTNSGEDSKFEGGLAQCGSDTPALDNKYYRRVG